MALKTLNVIGCGRVGQTLARLWQHGGQFAVQDLQARSLQSAAGAAAFIGAGRPVASLADMRPADVWMLTVPDTQVAAVAAALAATASTRAGGCSAASSDAADGPQPMAFHCSGFLASAVLAPLRERGWLVASAHPLLNFASPQTGVTQFAGTPCGVEGDAQAADLLTSALAAIGGEGFAVQGGLKPLYHAAAVFSCNFTVVLQAIAQDAWRTAGVPEALLPRLNAALLQNTVDNLLALGPAHALTGPAARGDVAVVNAQADAVQAWSPAAAEAYRSLSGLAMRLAQTGSVR